MNKRKIVTDYLNKWSGLISLSKLSELCEIKGNKISRALKGEKSRSLTDSEISKIYDKLKELKN